MRDYGSPAYWDGKDAPPSTAAAVSRRRRRRRRRRPTHAITDARVWDSSQCTQMLFHSHSLPLTPTPPTSSHVPPMIAGPLGGCSLLGGSLSGAERYAAQDGSNFDWCVEALRPRSVDPRRASCALALTTPASRTRATAPYRYQDFGTLRPHLLPYLQNHQNFEILIPVSVWGWLNTLATPSHFSPTCFNPSHPATASPYPDLCPSWTRRWLLMPATSYPPHTRLPSPPPTFRDAATHVWVPSCTTRAS